MFQQIKLRTKLIVTFILCALITGGTGLLGFYHTSVVGEEGQYIGLKLGPLGDAVMEIKLSVTSAHLILEEVINHPSSKVNPEKIWQYLDKGRWYTDAILQGAKNTKVHIYASQDLLVREKISNVKEKLQEFIIITHQRYELQRKMGIGSAIDQEFDELYHKIQNELSQVRQDYKGKQALSVVRLTGEAQYSIANAHFFFKELLSGEEQNQQEDIVSDLNRTLSDAKSIQSLTGNSRTQLIESITKIIKIAKKRIHETKQTNVISRENKEKFNQLFKDLIQKADQAAELIHKQIDKEELELKQNLEQAKWTMLFFSLVAMLLSICFATFLTRSVTRQVGGDPLEIIKITTDVAKGKIDHSFQTDRHNLTGIKAALWQMVESLKSKQKLAEGIAQGDLSTEVQLASDKDLLGIALQQMVMSLRKKVAIAESVAKGHLTVDIPLTSEQDTLGKSLRKMTASLKDKQKLVEEIALGDLNMEVYLASDEDLLGIALQKMVSNLRSKVLVAGAVAEGDLSIKVSLASEQDALGKNLRKMSDSLKAKQKLAEDIALGDLSKDVQLVSNKDLLGKALQKMVVNLRKKVSIAEAVAEGDLSIRVPLASDQDMLGKSLKKMIMNLNQLLREIVEGSTILASSSEELSSISSQMASSSTEASAQTDSVAKAIVEMTANISQMVTSSKEIDGNIQTISAASIETAQSMEEANKQVEEMGDTILEVASRAVEATKVSTSARETSRKASGRSEQLSTSASEIGEVTEIIKQIAQQTNLLALNANIEAASAGDAGRGFAVVANEIKDLAKESSKAAEEISRKIVTIQTDTEESVQAFRSMQEITEQINLSSGEIKDLSQQQSLSARLVQDSIKESTKGSEETARSIDDIAKAIEEFSLNNRELERGSTEISRNISTVNQLSGEASSAIENINLEASQLAGIAAQLKKTAGKFRLS